MGLTESQSGSEGALYVKYMSFETTVKRKNTITGFWANVAVRLAEHNARGTTLKKEVYNSTPAGYRDRKIPDLRNRFASDDSLIFAVEKIELKTLIQAEVEADQREEAQHMAWHFA